jgi:hypothetical protein
LPCGGHAGSVERRCVLWWIVNRDDTDVGLSPQLPGRVDASSIDHCAAFAVPRDARERSGVDESHPARSDCATSASGVWSVAWVTVS